MKGNRGLGCTNGWFRSLYMLLVGACIALPTVGEAEVVYKWLQLVEGIQSPENSSDLAASALVRAIVDHGNECPVLYDHKGKEVTTMKERKRDNSLKGFDEIKLCEAFFAASNKHVQAFNEVFFDEKQQHKAVTLPDLSHGVPMGSMVAYGCTGCRDGSAQTCAGEKKEWFFDKINQDAASRTKDGIPPLVVYMGDYRYSGQQVVNDSWTYATHKKGDKTLKTLGWKEEVFEPIKDLMDHGMFVHQRGNHEGCYVKENTWASKKVMRKWHDRGEGWLYFFGQGTVNCAQLAGEMNDMLPPFALDATIYGGTKKKPVVTNQRVRLAFLDTVRTGDARDVEQDLTRTLYKSALDLIDTQAVENLPDNRPVWIMSHIPAYGVKKGFEPTVVLQALEKSTIKKNLSKVSMLGAAHIHLFGLINGGVGNANTSGPFQFVVGNGGVVLNKNGGKELSCQESSVDTYGEWAGLKLAKLGYLYTHFDVKNKGQVTNATYEIPFFDEKTGDPIKTKVKCQGSNKDLRAIYCADFKEASSGTPACIVNE